MARACFSGVFQSCPSPPGVFLPSLFVTRCTARALPLNEWVRRCCRARTLPHRPACTAFTIRAWSLHRPVDGIPVNGMPGSRASGECTSQCCHRCHLPSLCRKLATISCDARPDGRLPAGAWGHVARALNPYPLHYSVAFASSILLFPHACRLALRLAFPGGRRTGFPCSVSVTTNGGGALCPPVALLPMTRNGKVLVPATVPFWPKPASTFGLFSVTMCIKRSPGFAIPSILAPSPSWC